MRVEDDDSDTILHNTQDAGLESHNSTTIEPTLAQGQTNPLHMQGVTPQISDPIGIMNLQPRRPDPCSAPYVEVSAIKLPCGPTDNPYMVRLTYVTAVEGTYCREPTAWISFRLPRRYVETCCCGSSI